MLITFKTKAFADISLVGKPAEEILKMLNYGLAIPGAIRAEDVQQALNNLQTALSELETPEPDPDDDQEPVIDLQRRAYPVIELLKAAIADDDFVRWD
ncbi:MAG: hypothetical protein ACI8XC_003567 [Gammaproteobacteria bacterium]